MTPEFAPVMVITSEILRSQYRGDQPIVQAIKGDCTQCKIPVETLIIVLQNHDDKFCDFSSAEVQAQLKTLSQAIATNEETLQRLELDYCHILRSQKAHYLQRGLLMKLHSKKKDPLSGEPHDAWVLRNQYSRAKRATKRRQQECDAFLREFQVFELGVDAAVLTRIKGAHSKARDHLISLLRSSCKEYVSRWCIESGYESIDYHFPLQYKGPSSDTHLRVYVLQASVFNSYRVAQIKHIKATKPHNWRPWDPKMKIRCRQFRTADTRSFTTKSYILQLLEKALNLYFCRALI